MLSIDTLFRYTDDLKCVVGVGLHSRKIQALKPFSAIIDTGAESLIIPVKTYVGLGYPMPPDSAFRGHRLAGLTGSVPYANATLDNFSIGDTSFGRVRVTVAQHAEDSSIKELVIVGQSILGWFDLELHPYTHSFKLTERMVTANLRPLGYINRFAFPSSVTKLVMQEKYDDLAMEMERLAKIIAHQK